MNYARKSIKNHFGAWRTLLSRIAVHASQKVVDAEVGDDDNEEGCNHVEVVYQRPPPCLPKGRDKRMVQWYSIYH